MDAWTHCVFLYTGEVSVGGAGAGCTIVGHTNWSVTKHAAKKNATIWGYYFVISFHITTCMRKTSYLGRARDQTLSMVQEPFKTLLFSKSYKHERCLRSPQTGATFSHCGEHVCERWREASFGPAAESGLSFFSFFRTRRETICLLAPHGADSKIRIKKNRYGHRDLARD